MMAMNAIMAGVVWVVVQTAPADPTAIKRYMVDGQAYATQGLCEFLGLSNQPQSSPAMTFTCETVAIRSHK